MIYSGYSSAQFLDKNIIYVGGNQANYTTIQDAINAASNGDTIYVSHGVYHENILIDKSINLVGEDKTTTIIDGGKHGNVVTLSHLSTQVNLTGFTIQNSGFQYYDSGIDVNSDYNTIAGNIIKDCGYGVSLDLWGHNCRIYDNTFKDNTYGVVVYSVIPNSNIIYHNNFIDNHINAYDNSNSSWMYHGEGNYWDDYTGSDENNDGIGDTPYVIPGGNTYDPYPLMELYETPGFDMILGIISIVMMIVILKSKQKTSR